jgi:hypothetical protein
MGCSKWTDGLGAVTKVPEVLRTSGRKSTDSWRAHRVGLHRTSDPTTRPMHSA